MHYLEWVSYLGDSVTSASLVIGIALLFAWRDELHFALHWLLVNAVGVVLVSVSKIAFIGWGLGIETLDYTGLSGHAMRAALVFPVMAFLMLGYPRRPLQILAFAVIVSVSFLVGYSRLLLHVHSWFEVLMGWMVGFVFAAHFITAIRTAGVKLSYQPLLVFLILPFFFFTSLGVTPTQRWLVTVSLYLSGNEQAYTRSHWR